MPLRDFVAGRTNKIIIGGLASAGLLFGVGSTLIRWVQPAIRIESTDNERLWEVSTRGAIGVGTGANAFGANGDCLKSGGGSGNLMSYGSCGTGGGGSVNTGSILAAGDSRFVNVSGDTMTGTLLGPLARFQTLSGSSIYAKNSIASSGSLTWEGAASGASLWISSLNGSQIIKPGMFAVGDFGVFSCIEAGCLLDADTVTSSQISDDSIGASELDDGSDTPATDNVLMVDNADTTQFAYIAVPDCDDSTGQHLNYDTGTQSFTCGTSGDGNTTYAAGPGIVFDGNRIRTADTLTGTLLRMRTVSGSAVFAKTSLASSGSLVVNGVARVKNTLNATTLSGGLLTIQHGTSYFRGSVGIGKTTPSVALDVLGTMSGSSLTVTNLKNCDTIDTNSEGVLTCGTDNAGGGSFDQGATDKRYVQKQGDTMTGKLLIDLTSGSEGLEVIETISGATIYAAGGSVVLSKTAALAGQVKVLDFAGSDAISFYATAAGGGLDLYEAAGDVRISLTESAAGFYETTGTTPTLYVDMVAERVGIGSASPETKLEVVGTASGRILHAQDLLRSSGALAVQTTGLFKGNLTTKGALSGATLTTSTLRGCTALETSATGVVGCGTDDVGAGGAVFGSGNVLTILQGTDNATSTGALKKYFDPLENARFVNTSGDTMTGTLTVSLTSGLRGIDVKQIASGSQVHAARTLASSGTLVAKESVTFKALTSCANMKTDANGLLSCNNAVYLATSTGSLDSRYLQLTGGRLSGTLNGTTISGSLIRGVTVSGSLVHASTTLASSGTLVVKGAVTLKGVVSCTSLASSSAGALSCNNAVYLATSTGSLETRFNGLYFRSSTGSLKKYFDPLNDARFVNTSGDTMTGKLLINLTTGTDALEIIGIGSGRVLRAHDLLQSSGSLTVQTTTLLKGNVTTRGTFSGATTITLTAFKGCTALETDSQGALACGSDSEGSGSFNQGQTDQRYVNTSGDTMTGGLLIQSGNPAGTIDAGLLLEIAGTASGRILHAQDLLRSSGSLTVQTTGLFKGNLTTRGNLSGASLTVTGLKSCSTVTTDSSGNTSCGGMVVKRKSANESVTSNAVAQEDDHLFWKTGASETWIFRMMLNAYSTSTIPDLRLSVSAPTGSTCAVYANIIAPSGAAAQDVSAFTSNCGKELTGLAINTASVINPLEVWGTVVTAGTTGSGMLRWAQNTSNATAVTLMSGSVLMAFKAVGSDLAEVYYSRSGNIMPGTVVVLDPEIFAGVRPSSSRYDSSAIGIISTKPGHVIGGGDGPVEGSPVFVALAGRVPVLVSDENGPVKIGDFLTTSSRPGVAMRSTEAGPVIGQALTGFSGKGEGIVTAFVKNGFRPPSP